MISVKILGSGCQKCSTLESKVRDLVAKNNIDASVEKVTDINEIITYGVMMTPAVVIKGKVKNTGIIPKDDELLTWLREN